MKKIIIGLMILCSTIFAGEITVAAAANVGYVIEKLVKEFNKTNPDIKVEIVLGSSGKLVSQIEYGAFYDIFMSADMTFPKALYDKKLAITEPVVYAQGVLSLFSAKELDYSKNLALLKDASISKIAVANPKTAPYGAAAVEAMKNFGIEDATKDKLVYAESISQVVTYATTATDVGFVAKSSLYDEKMLQYKQNKNWIDVDQKLYTPINQGMVIVDNTKNLVGYTRNEMKKAEIKAFYDFILSATAKKIFQDYGYIVK